MSEKTEKLYKKYLEEKLDAIFNVDREEYKKNNDSNKDKVNITEEKSTAYTYYEMIEKNGKYNFIDTNGKLVSEEWYDNASYFENGYARVKKYDKWNFIDTNGKLISYVWFDHVKNFKNGYALVRKNGKYNFIDTNGRVISEEWYEVLDFKNGYTIVRANGKTNLIDTENGKLVSEEWYDGIGTFENGYALVRKNGKYNFIDTNGKLVSEEWYDGVWDWEFSFIDTNGKLVSEEWYDDVWEFSEGYAKVRRNGKYNFIDTSGKLVSEKWYYRWNIEVISPNFIMVKSHIMPTKLIHNYDIKKKIFGYECSKDNDKFRVKYRPIKVFGLRYVMCLDKDKIYLFDRKTNTYESIGTVYTIEYDDNFIFDKNNKKVYLMYDDKNIDITDYYNKYLKDKGEIQIKEGIKLLTKDDFFYHSEDEIRKLVEEEKEKEEKLRKEKEKEGEERKLKELKEQEEKEKQERIKSKKETLNKLQELVIRLSELEKETDSKDKITVENIFIEVGDHKEINPIYLEIGMLRHIDLSYISFKNVKIDGIDFRGCNISLRPQEVYGKNLSGCNFEGLFINPFMDFNGVDIRGSRFSDDNDSKTIDRQNVTFQNAIYDDTTTYNGISFTKIYGECKNLNKGQGK